MHPSNKLTNITKYDKLNAINLVLREMAFLIYNEAGRLIAAKIAA
jgi:hypothetical protein